jgi:hypothetical protein
MCPPKISSNQFTRNVNGIECTANASSGNIGAYDGESGARLLDRIPDVVLRLFAEIEFAAGIAGLEQIGSITREQLRGHK